MPADFIVDPEFRRANRPQTKRERADLIELIVEEGCAEGAITVGIVDGIRYLVDGHNTWDICKCRNIPLSPPRIKNFASREDVLAWIRKRQRARRNLTAQEMKANRSVRVARIAKARIEGMSTRAIAKDEGISQRQVWDDLKTAEAEGYEMPRLKCDRCQRLRLIRRPGECKNCDWVNDQPRKTPTPIPHEPTKACKKCNGTGRVPNLPPKKPLKAADLKFVKPTVEEVRAYCLVRKNFVDPELFVAHYDSKGWLVGKSPMVDWQAAVRTWEKNEYSHSRLANPPETEEEKRASDEALKRKYGDLGDNGAE